MTKNIGKADKIIRVAVGIYLIVFTSFIFQIIGVALIITAITGKCWLYKILGINTCAHELSNPMPTEVKNSETLETSEQKTENIPSEDNITK